LKEPFLFTLANGTLAEVRLAPKASRFADSILRTVAAAFQFRGPVDAKNPRSWTVKEADAPGTYEAEYRIAGQVIEERKVGYEPMPVGQFGRAVAKLKPEVLSFKGVLTLKETGGGSAASSTSTEFGGVAYEEQVQVEST